MMSRGAAPHQPLTACRVVYIGRAAPTSTFEGLDSIQKPLCELYRKSKWDPKKVFDHMRSNMHVFSSGLLLRPVNPLDKDVWFKMQDLESCSAVKAYNDPSCRGRLLFVPNDSANASMSEHPSMFALIMKRNSGGIKISDCHAFICNSDRSAISLVRATAHAFANQSGWSDERPTLVELGLERPEVKIDNECYVDDIKDDCTPEYYDKPKLSGFFYTPRTDLIQKYSVKGEDCYGRPIGEEVTRPFTCDELDLPPREPPQTAVIVLQSGCQQTCCPETDCCQTPVTCQAVCQPIPYRQSPAQQPQQYGMVPQQAQIMYGGNGIGDWRSTEKKKTGKKSSKKDQRQVNHYVAQNPSQPQPYTDPNGDQYLVDGPQFNGGSGDPVYTKYLPQANGVSPQQVQMYGAQPHVDYDYRQVGAQNGMGDYGPPQHVEYVEYRGNGQAGGDVDLYSRRLPGQGGMGNGTAGRNYDGNFMMKPSNGYGVPTGYGINMGALTINDRY